MPSDDYPPIADYGLLSDCHSAALVSRSGSIDWACLRRFDAGSAFGRLLDWGKGGFFSLRVREAGSVRRRYEPGSLVLTTELTGDRGTVRLTDAFAMRAGGSTAPAHMLLRAAEVIEGEVELDVVVAPRFDYGSLRPWLRHHGGDAYSAVGGDDALVIRSALPLEVDREGSRLFASRHLVRGQRIRFALVSQWAHELDPSQGDLDAFDDRLDATVAWWRDWSASTAAPEPYRHVIRQSAAVLKGLTCAPTGAVVAAPTTSLPEHVGGGRNWDYRYAWIRDATLALDALATAGHPDVARGFRDFLLRSAAGHADDLQIMYGPYGARRLTEQELDLDGYRGSRPVRVGNSAAAQTQLDVYGHILDAAHHWHARHEEVDDDEWRFLREVVDVAAQRWQEPDRGLWEVRGEPRQFVHSKVMIWVALDRGARLADELDDDAAARRWREVAGKVRAAVERHGVIDGHFTQVFGLDGVDASLLKLVDAGFVDADDPRMVRTVDVIRERLGTPEGFLRRYESGGDDGMGGEHEGVFLLCSFWLVDVLVALDRVDEASELFDRLVAVGNDLSLFSEEYDPATGELLGNFPQAFTHLGLIGSATRLARATSSPDGRRR
jgi:GH15 family glucan-1,4-alpha-glucosidase